MLNVEPKMWLVFLGIFSLLKHILTHLKNIFWPKWKTFHELNPAEGHSDSQNCIKISVPPSKDYHTSFPLCFAVQTSFLIIFCECISSGKQQINLFAPYCKCALNFNNQTVSSYMYTIIWHVCVHWMRWKVNETCVSWLDQLRQDGG